MKITITHNADDHGNPKVGYTDSWTAPSDACARTGIGRTWGEALESLVRANLDTFGVNELVTEDRWNEANPVMRWAAKSAALDSPHAGA